MHIKDKIDIAATPQQVWPFIVDPVLQAAWNPKIVSIDRPHDGPVVVGETYKMTAKLSEQEKTSRVEVIELIEAERLVFRHEMTEAGKGFAVTETFTLKPTGNDTRVQHTIDLRHSPIPMLIRPLIWLIMTFGKPVGEAQLAKLKRMIESELGT
jgi:uncharacterized protein YndB with AHSA1/START domain